jgi:uncharacterized membrane protein YhaH (DUF805 family)
MSPIDWAMRPLKKYAQFSGRAPRAEYWWFYLGYVVFAIILDVLMRISSIFGILGIAYLGLIIPMIAVGVRRLHDTNRSGWWLLAPALPYLIGLVLIMPAMMSGMAAGAGGAAVNPFSMASMGAAGIFMLIGFVLAIVVFVFTVLPGTNGPNKYGEDPYGGDLGEVFA